MSVIDRINDLLKQKNISAAKMSKDLGFSSGLFSQWKKGLQKPSASKISLMANYFGVSTDYLYDLNDKETPPADTTESEIEAVRNRLLDLSEPDLAALDLFLDFLAYRRSRDLP